MKKMLLTVCRFLALSYIMDCKSILFYLFSAVFSTVTCALTMFLSIPSIFIIKSIYSVHYQGRIEKGMASFDKGAGVRKDSQIKMC